MTAGAPRPASIRAAAPRRVALSRGQRDRLATAAATLTRRAKRGEDAPGGLALAAELERVVSAWDAADHASPAAAREPRLREALRRIAEAESGLWGWIAHDALTADAAATDTPADDPATPDEHGAETVAKTIASGGGPLAATARR